MNYRHSYHAGNFADVVKHSLQWLVLDYLGQKDKPYWVLDTHAGIGMYDLQGEQAQKTGEATDGIARLLGRDDIPAVLQSYVAQVQQLNPTGELRWYPGSPWFSAEQLRAQDQLVLCELHPQDSLALAANVKQEFASAGSIKVLTETNGYAALKGLLPPPIKRGLVLIDPPFEQRDELQTLVAALDAATKRWAIGVYAVWYPIKDPLSIGDFHQQVAQLKHVQKAYAVDILIRDAQDRQTLNGCGMLFINPPFGLLQQVDEVMNYLTPLLAQGRGAQWQGVWLT
ncbi:MULTISPECIES: 23S rRNA (adenine(2030)-N(6))-methyltransferase RlmJ [Pseudidiomarina]|uniref:Ribosomal RNA large subunit methyltransferase J n=2 Tax=Pseudidiomarina TaxID=2800384 RepID=A0A368V1U9_9GAMM|nr:MULTISPECIES: 23S rRNA (adenine(2030)-N(6))-methyltransferase RlmJ [Pseudidiomarina]PWW14086.1 23S rRNA (adenine2030-N6)-methyltransferase [Pseudidiomarina maritima]RBP91900.1 23S rRNA (adenine2030-N6)-methyltransferase [Pseudidiomarina tainanensis]RCW33664.1 23S rRNA (adenine2030-N6)-methyltransferase [Pseudidiomarina tainanensis]